MSNEPPRAPKIEEGQGFLSSSLAKAGEHFGAKDTEEADATERWATRIGRGLSVIAFVFLAWYLGVQLKWW